MLGEEKGEVDVVEGVEEKPEVEKADCAPCTGGFPKSEAAGGTGNKLDDGVECEELDDDSDLEAEASSFSFWILWRVDLYDSRIPDMSAKGSSSMPLEMALRKE